MNPKLKRRTLAALSTSPPLVVAIMGCGPKKDYRYSSCTKNQRKFFQTQPGVFIWVRKRYPPPPSKYDIFPPLVTWRFSTPIVAFLP
jgi:hypothetical protein